jgi:hypothetical protein
MHIDATTLNFLTTKYILQELHNHGTVLVLCSLVQEDFCLPFYNNTY